MVRAKLPGPLLGWTALRHRVPVFGCHHPNREPPAMVLKRIATARSNPVSPRRGVAPRVRVALRRERRRARWGPFFRKLPPPEVVLEAGGGPHHGGRFLPELGHTVKLTPPQYVK